MHMISGLLTSEGVNSTYKSGALLFPATRDRGHVKSVLEALRLSQLAPGSSSHDLTSFPFYKLSSAACSSQDTPQTSCLSSSPKQSTTTATPRPEVGTPSQANTSSNFSKCPLHTPWALTRFPLTVRSFLTLTLTKTVNHSRFSFSSRLWFLKTILESIAVVAGVQS